MTKAIQKEVKNQSEKDTRKEKAKIWNKIEIDNEKFIKESLEELQMLIEEEDRLYKADSPPKQPKMITLENNTISEVDERDEEETIFDQEGKRLFSRSLKSSRCRNEGHTKVLFHDIAASSERWDKLLLDQGYHMNCNQNSSIESESVKFEEDLLNDTLKLDDPIF